MEIPLKLAIKNFYQINDSYVSELISICFLFESSIYGIEITDGYDFTDFEETPDDHGIYNLSEVMRKRLYDQFYKEYNLTKFPIILLIAVLDAFIESVYNGWLKNTDLFSSIIDDYKELLLLGKINQENSSTKIRHFLRKIESSQYGYPGNNRKEKYEKLLNDYINERLASPKDIKYYNPENLFFRDYVNFPFDYEKTIKIHYSLRAKRNKIVHSNYFINTDEIDNDEVKYALANTFEILIALRFAPFLWVSN